MVSVKERRRVRSYWILGKVGLENFKVVFVLVASAAFSRRC